MIFVRTVISPETVVFSLLFELRMAESPLTLRLLEVSEVILERGPEVLDRLLRRVLGDLPHPWERVVLEAIELAAQRCLGPSLASLGLPAPLSECQLYANRAVPQALAK